MKDIRILAVIPAYNSAEYVERAITSLLKQDYPFLRKIVIDDCSKDNTLEIINQYQGKIEVLQNRANSGFCYSLNRALSLVKDEEFLFVLEDDIELIDQDYVTRALKHFTDTGLAVVCGQAVDFSRQRLSLTERAFARYLNLDYQEKNLVEVSYTLLKADLIRISALKQVGSFGFAGNPKLGVEDQILAKRLRDKGYRLLKDPALQYRLNFARRNSLIDFLRSEANAGKTLGVAVSSGVISLNPVQSTETRLKSNYRRMQVIMVTLILLSFLLFFLSYKVTVAVILGILVLDFANYLRKSKGFSGWEKLCFAIIGLVNDFVFSFRFCWGLLRGLNIEREQ